MKKNISFLLIIALCCALIMPALAAGDPDIACFIDGKLDTAVRFSGQSTLIATWRLVVTEPDLMLTNTQGIRLAYDNSVLQLIRWDAAGAFHDSGIGTLFEGPMDGASLPGAFDTTTRRVFAAKDISGSTGYLSLALGNEESFHDCAQGEDIPLMHIRFAFRSGKSEADLTKDSIRIMTVPELEATAQSCAALINAYANGDPASFASYEYMRQRAGTLLGGDTLDAPTVAVPIPGTKTLYGDVNGDGKVDGSDVQALVLWINAGRPAGGIDEVAARVSSATGRPDGSDVQALVLWINAGGNPLVGHPGPNP